MADDEAEPALIAKFGPGWRPSPALAPAGPVAAAEGPRRRRHEQLEDDENRRRPDLVRTRDLPEISMQRNLKWRKRRETAVLTAWKPREWDRPEEVMTSEQVDAFVAALHMLGQELEPERVAGQDLDGRREAIRGLKTLIPDVDGEQTDSSDTDDEFDWDWEQILRATPQTA
jgi:hypothetical protein